MKRKETYIKAMAYGLIAATAIILHNLFIHLYPYINL